MRVAVPLLLLAAASTGAEPAVDLPRLTEAGGSTDADAAGLVVRLDAEGVVWAQLRAKDGRRSKKWQRTSLNQLSTFLDTERRIFGKGRTPSGSTPLPLTFDVDRRAPWILVDWVMVIASEQRFTNIRFAALHDGRRVLVTLPAPEDRPIDPVPREPAPTVDLRIDARSAANEDGRPTEVRLQVPGHGAIDREKLVELTEGRKQTLAKKDENTRLQAKLFVSERAPAGEIVPLIARLWTLGFDQVHAYSSRIPPPEVRRDLPLPYPRGDRLPEHVFGRTSR